MRQNHMLTLLRQGKPTLGLWLHTQNFHTARMIAAQELFDWLLVDMEHSPVDLSTVSTILAAVADYSGGNCAPLVRVPQGTMPYIKQALDSGAYGIVVPMVNTAEDAAQVVRYARYPPQGERGAGGLVPHINFGLTDRIEYIKHANDEIMVAVQIETQEAVDNIDAILDTPGIDLAFIGPFDLHMSLGMVIDRWSDEPAFQSAVQKVIAACKARGLPYGTMTPNADGAKARLAEGFTFISVGSDMNQLLGALRSQMGQVRSSLNS